MKQVIHNTIVVLLTLVVVGTANAIPRLQTFINGSKYVRGYDGRFDGTWMTHNASFRLDVIGAWHSGPRVGWRPNHRSMDTYLVIGVPQGETGEVWVDGTRLSSVANDFDNVRPAGFAGRLGRVQPSAHGALDLRFYHLGQIDNEERKVVDCAPLGA
ncbi:MAG: hypothetical protein OEN01_16105, partial [Candidatus Krumholzibacteria bacterium]|nr:hypothetical protein [Candidatus Krumholzibacteria bacterium]